MKNIFFIVLSFIIVAFGQPAWQPYFGLVAAAIGYALFWRILLDIESNKSRFWLATAWFMGIQMIQLSWFISHPYLYIYILWVLLSFLFSLPFGGIALLMQRDKVTKLKTILLVPALWVLFEWSKLFILSGFSWNPVGMALVGNIYTLQMASVGGIFGLSFWVFFTNMLALRAFLQKKFLPWALACMAPYFFGALHFHYYEAQMEKTSAKNLNVVLVQTAFPVEEAMQFDSQEHLVAFVMDEWKQILKIIKQHRGLQIDLIALPEFVVPFGTYTFVFTYDKVKEVFVSIFGPESVSALPAREIPFAVLRERKWMVNNAFWAQAISNLFKAGLVVGLEDVDDLPFGGRQYFSSALYFEPYQDPFMPQRYAKRVLVPMGEYIPFSFCKDLAARYGICSSFTCGQEAAAWACGSTKFGVSICYEETFGHLMRENRTKGAELLVNITSDAWYPNSRLPKQHLEHARLRTVENGFPLVRACNTGITVAIDALGRDVATLALDAVDPESVSDSLYVSVPSFHYFTVYSLFGDWLIVGLSVLILVAVYTMRQCKK